MHPRRITYYRLRGNERLLTTGFPIFTYHKIGSRPQHTKWRSLYLSPRRFARQMGELASAGYSTARLSGLRPAEGNPGKKFAITFDDGYANVAAHAVPVLAAHRFQAIQFIVAELIGGENSWDVNEGEVPERLMNVEEIREWLRMGHEIGSHTGTHPRLTRIPRAQMKEEIGASKRRLEDLFGVPVRHFSYPYGDYDNHVIAEVARAGYETACTHLESGLCSSGTPSLELPRIEARYPRRNLKAFVRGVFGWLGGNLKSA